MIPLPSTGRTHRVAPVPFPYGVEIIAIYIITQSTYEVWGYTPRRACKAIGIIANVVHVSTVVIQRHSYAC